MNKTTTFYSDKIPKKYLYQTNGKTIQENYATIHKERQEEYKSMLLEKQQQEHLNAELQQQIEELVSRTIGDLLSTLQN